LQTNKKHNLQLIWAYQGMSQKLSFSFAEKAKYMHYCLLLCLGSHKFI